MRYLVIFVVLGTIWVGVEKQTGQSPLAHLRGGVAQASTNSLGFRAAVMPEGARPGEVVIMTPINCTAEEVAMGEQLEDQLRAAGIPARRTSSMSFSAPAGDQDYQRYIKQTVSLIEDQDPPLVFVNGYAKARPSVSDVRQQLALPPR